MRLAIYLIFLFLSIVSCKSETQKQTDSVINTETKSEKVSEQKQVDSSLTAKQSPEEIRKKLQKQGYIYHALIESTEQMDYDSKKLSFVQSLYDNEVKKGDIYVELVNDSIFKSLYIFDMNKKIKYEVGNGIFTNLTDTTKYSETDFFGFKFVVRCKKYVAFTLANPQGESNSDRWHLEYMSDTDGFDNPQRFL